MMFGLILEHEKRYRSSHKDNSHRGNERRSEDPIPRDEGWPQATTGSVALSGAQLSMLLEGID